jgi:hypothetical protein
LGHSDPAESPYCDACCRDHHDAASAGVTITGAKFDPWRTTHDHYNVDNSGNQVKVTSGQYREVCRLIRVDGIYRVAADFNDEYFNLLKTNKMAANGVTPEYVPTSSTTSPLGSTQNYQAMVLNYLDAKVTNNSTPSTYNTPLTSAAVATLETTNNINDPTTQNFSDRNDYDWMHARGLYIDYLEPEALAAIATAKANCVTNSCTTAEKQVAVLSVVPFTSINVSDLANWSPVTTDHLYINVSPGTFYDSTNDPNIPIRGKASVLSGLASTALTATGTAKMFSSNSGLTAYLTAIDPDEALAANLRTDSQAFSIPAAGASANPGNFTVNTSNLTFAQTYLPQFSYPNANVSGCSPTTTKVHGVDTYASPFTCGSTNLGVPLVLTVGHYNTSTLATLTSPSISNCTDTAGVGSPKSSGTTAYSAYQCTNYAIASATVGASNTPAISITPTNDGNQAETSAVSFSNVGINDPITLNFTSSTTTRAPTTCTYTDTQTCVTHGHTTTCGLPIITTFSITGSTPCP